VPGFFYIADSDPPVEEEPFVETNTYRATRKDLTIDHVLNRMGRRSPAYPDTQRLFKVLFVLVYDPDRPLPTEDVNEVRHYASVMERDFAKATGNRGTITTAFGTPTSPRRRSARH